MPSLRNTSAKLRAARLIAASGVALLGQLLVHMPEGYFGRTVAMTTVGETYSILVAVLTLISAMGELRRRSWARFAGLLVLLVNFVAFLPPLATDPVATSVIAFWQLVIIVNQYLRSTPVERLDPRLLRIEERDHLAPWMRRSRLAVQHLALVSAMISIVAIGHELSSQWLALAVATSMQAATLFFVSGLLRLVHRHERKTFYILMAPLILATMLVAAPNMFLAALTIFDFMLLIILLRYSPVWRELLRLGFASPVVSVAGSFLFLIGSGTLLLSLPAATVEPIAPIDAFFTAVSAACVTGLSTVEIQTFTTFGHGVILALIQLGGLGIIVFSTFAALLVTGSIGLRGERAVGELLEAPGTRGARRLVFFIVTTTFAIEAVGALLLFPTFHASEPSILQAAWKSVFHAVSAFCNAGFALQSDSLTGLQSQAMPLFVIATLIALGGIGFVTLATLLGKLKPRRLMKAKRREQLRVNVKLILVTSGILIAASTMFFLVAEWNASLQNLSVTDKIINSLFQGVTSRTAGYNSVDFAELRSGTAFLMIFFMFIGGAPGGTAGGIKVTTAAILFACIPALARGEASIRFFGRTISRGIILRSAAITVIGSGTVFVITTLLIFTQDLPALELLFETASAHGTVGLSLGVTPRLDFVGKFLIIIAMFLGRIGPLTIALAFGRKSTGRVSLPEESIMVG